MIDERDFVPQTTKQARDLYHALVAADVPVAQARGIVTWLLVLPERRADDPASNMLRRDYRRCLLLLEIPPWKKSLVAVGGSQAKGVLRSSSTERLTVRRFRWSHRRAEAAAA